MISLTPNPAEVSDKLSFALRQLRTVIRLLPLIPDHHLNDVYKDVLHAPVVDAAEALTDLVELMEAAATQR